MEYDDEVKDLRERFTITCRKCGSEDVAVNIECGETDVENCPEGWALWGAALAAHQKGD